MIIEFELKGSKGLHKGIFDTTGFWCRYEEDVEHGQVDADNNFTWVVNGYKIFSHCSFSFYSDNKEVVDLVYNRLISMLRGSNSIDIEDVGYFRRLNK